VEVCFASKEKEYMQLMDLVQGYEVSPVQYPPDQLYGECLDQKSLWPIGPEKVCKFDPSDDIAVHVAMANTLDESEKNLRELSQSQERFAPKLKRNRESFFLCRLHFFHFFF
jgi:hypothetical protein